MVKNTFENYVELIFILILLYFIAFVKSFPFGRYNISKSVIKIFLLLCLIYFLYISPFAGAIFAIWLLKFMYYDQKQSEFFENRYSTITQAELDQLEASDPGSVVNVTMPTESNILSNSSIDDEIEDSGDTYSGDFNNSYMSNEQSETEINNDPENVGIETMGVLAESEEIEGPRGCTYSLASNFNPNAVVDDGSCTFDNVASTVNTVNTASTTNNLQGYSGMGPYSIKVEYSYLQ